MVNAGLREPKCPYCKERRPGKVVDAQALPDHRYFAATVVNTLQGCWVALRNRKDTKWAPTAVLNVKQARNAGLPTGREPYGNGVAVVVSGGESPLQGEGRQVDWNGREDVVSAMLIYPSS